MARSASLRFAAPALALALGTCAVVQERGRAVEQERGRVVAGTVCDEAGGPVLEASVHLEPLAPWREPELAELLPRARSDARGRYTLTIPPDQMAMQSLETSLVLRVECAGFQPWCEHVPAPLGLFEGSYVTLRRVREQDAAVVRVEHPVPGMVLFVERSGAHCESYLYWTCGHVEQAGEPVAVPASGEVHLNLPLLPSPLAVPTGRHGLLPLGWQVRLVYPGRSLPPRAVAAGSTVTLREREPVPTRAVRRSDGRPVEHLRVLVDLMWSPPEFGYVVTRSLCFDLPGAEVPVDPFAPPHLVMADGCGPHIYNRETSGDVILEPMQPVREFRLVDELGKPVDRVHVTWRPDEQNSSRRFHDTVHGQHWVVNGGLLHLDDRQVLEPGTFADEPMIERRRNTVEAFEEHIRLLR